MLSIIFCPGCAEEIVFFLEKVQEGDRTGMRSAVSSTNCGEKHQKPG